MKKLSTLLWAMAVVVATMLSSCSKSDADSRAELLSQLSDEAFVTVSLDPMALFKSAGATVEGGRVVLPPELQCMTRGDNPVSRIVALSGAKGVDRHSLVVSVTYPEKVVMLFAISDKGDFSAWARGEGYNESTADGMTVYDAPGEDFAVVVDGNIGSVVNAKGIEAIKLRQQACEAAAANPMPQWRAERLAEGDVAIAIDGARLKEIVSSISSDFMPEGFQGDYAITVIDFKGPRIEYKAHAYDRGGKEMEMLKPGTYKPVSTESLALVGGNDLVWALAIGDDYKAMMRREMSMYAHEASDDYGAVVDSMLNVVDAFAMGISVKKDAGILGFGADSFSGAIVVDSKKDAVERTMTEGRNNVAALLGGSGVSLTDGPDNSVEINAGGKMKLYAYGRGDRFVLSTNPPAALSPFKGLTYSDGLVAYMSLNLAPDRLPLNLIGSSFGIEARAETTAHVSEGYIELTGADGGFIENILKLLRKF